jgi:hypothetical protein
MCVGHAPQSSRASAAALPLRCPLRSAFALDPRSTPREPCRYRLYPPGSCRRSTGSSAGTRIASSQSSGSASAEHFECPRAFAVGNVIAETRTSSVQHQPPSIYVACKGLKYLAGVVVKPQTAKSSARVMPTALLSSPIRAPRHVGLSDRQRRERYHL